MLAKWWARLNENKNVLWKSIVLNSFGPSFRGKLMFETANVNIQNLSPLWNDIVSLKDDNCMEPILGNGTWKWKVGNGSKTLFWLDSWLCSMPLYLKYPSLFRFSHYQNETVCFFQFHDSTYNNGWFIYVDFPLQSFDSSEFDLMMDELRNVVLIEDKDDVMFWVPALDGCYSVSDGVRLLVNDNADSIPEWANLIWYNPIPSKVLIFHWLSIQGCIPVKKVLLQRDILQDGQNASCFWCFNTLESVNHLLLHCPWATLIWAEVFRWWNITWVMPSSLASFSYSWGSGMGIKAGKLCRLIGPVTIWLIWLARNNALFNNDFTCWSVIAKQIKIKSFEWATNARFCYSHQFYIWESNPWALL
ncbi:uncharacterized protein [Rutidosis leptorrhynchoides]|uniref:uncharacterized protein n=1 Tax=Rutidosis leptorrhynchoides TaxID=125765 RepID=UPI003A9906C5